MIKKWFIAFFLLFIIAGFFYQENYVKNLRLQSKDQLHKTSETTKAILGEGFDFITFFYNQDGTLKASFSGKKIVYYQDATFYAEGSLTYQSYDKNSKPLVFIQTEFANGQFEMPQSKNSSIFLGDKQLKWLQLPQNVAFNFDGNRGTTKNVFIDAVKRTISSNEHINSIGPDGSISADGFFYDIDNKEFKLNSSVRGTYKPPKQDRK